MKEEPIIETIVINRNIKGKLKPEQIVKIDLPTTETNEKKTMTEKPVCKYKYQDREKYKFQGKPYCSCFFELCEDLPICEDNCQIYEDYKQLKRKEQELQNNERIINRSIKKLDQLKAENEKLKEYLEISEITTLEDGDLVFESKFIDEFVEENTKLKQALDEIEEVWQEDEDGDYDFIKYKILDIINKAKEKEC